MSDNLIESQCHKCGVIGESILSWAGPHIKQSCASCGAYIKFYDKARIPDVREVKIQIWGLAASDIELIDKIKSNIRFVENLSGLDAKLEYYKLYKAIKTFKSVNA